MDHTLSFLISRVRKSRRAYFGALVLLLVSRAAGLVLPVATKFVVDEVLRGGNRGLLPLVVAAVLGGAVVQAVTSRQVTIVTGAIVHRTIAEARERLSAHILRLPIAWHDDRPSAVQAASVLHDTERMRAVLGPGMVDFAGGLITAAMASALLVRIHLWLSAIVAVAALATAILLAATYRRIRPMARRRACLQERLAAQLSDSFAGVRTVRSYRSEAAHDERFRSTMATWREESDAGQRVSASLTSAVVFLGGVVEAVIIWAGCREVLAGALSIGELATFVVTLGFLLFPVFQVVSLGPQVAEAMAAAERICSVLEFPPEETQSKSAIPAHRALDVEFDAVCFEYVQGEPVLRNASFVAEAGRTTAIVGCSGAGKSTIAALAAGFYRPQRGSIRVNGVSATELGAEDYGPAIAVVSQEAYLFNTTVRENILCARSCESAHFEAVCRATGVDVIASELPEGYDTEVGERGVKLSGGQRQRVCMARAVLGNPGVLLLDEATSSIEPSAESELRREIAPLLADRTVIVVAHRLCTVRQCDEILVLESGRVVERGTHESLVALGGAYARMFAAELAAEAEFAVATSPTV